MFAITAVMGDSLRWVVTEYGSYPILFGVRRDGVGRVKARLAYAHAGSSCRRQFVYAIDDRGERG